MSYQLPPWLSLIAPPAVAVALVAALLVAGKVPLSYNLRNLRIRWKTTVLTALAFTVVVALLMVMHAFATGIQRLSQGSGQPANVIVLSDGASDELYSNLPLSETSDLARQEGVLRDTAGRPLCSREVYVFINQPVPVREGQRPKHRFLAIRGVEEPSVSALVHGLELSSGTWFSEAGVRDLSSANRERASTASPYAHVEAVLGEGLAREFGRDRDKESLEVGDVFPLGPRQGVVVGIMRGADTTFGSEVWAKRQKIGEIFGKETFYTSLVLRTDGPARAQQLAQWLSRDFKKVAVSAMTETEYFAKMSEVNEQLLGAIYFVAGIMALGGVFGVMNTMFAAIRQRTTDIGVLRILGFARWQVLVSFLLEAMVIAALGGVLGCGLGYLVNGMNTNSVVGTSGGGMKRLSFQMIVDGNTLAAAVLFTLVMGFLGGLLPAMSAMRQKPLESLR
ncbi:MAG TPA: ABC transporter permease [Gemmataceae bacterium]|nr:ABC transporter permease [Gemmataceae bacterium]